MTDQELGTQNFGRGSRCHHPVPTPNLPPPGPRDTYPGEADAADGPTQHVCKHGRVRAGCREVGEEVGAVPVCHLQEARLSLGVGTQDPGCSWLPGRSSCLQMPATPTPSPVPCSVYAPAGLNIGELFSLPLYTGHSKVSKNSAVLRFRQGLGTALLVVCTKLAFPKIGLEN